MALSKYNSRKVDLNTCTICFETFKTPKYFPCLHSFCEGCIETYIKTTFVHEKGGIDCPVCRTFVSKPDDISKEEWSSKLPTNHVLVSLMDTNESKSGRKLCSACSRENETENASSWCMNCGEALCKSCERYHRRNKSSATHKLVDLENYKETDLPLHHADIPCTDHPDKNVEAYCRDHSAACCMTCAFLKHRNCKNVGSIQDVAEETKNSKAVESFSDSMHEFQKSLNALLQYTGTNLQEFDKDVEKMKADVETLFIKLSTHLRQLKSDILSEIAQVEKEVRPEIEDKHDEIKRKISTIGNNLALFQTNLKHAPPAQFLQAMEKLIEQRLMIEQFVNDESKTVKETRVTFDANEKLMEIEKDIKVFGDVKISRTSKDEMQMRSADRYVNMCSVVPTLTSEVDVPSSVKGTAILQNGHVLMSQWRSNTIELRDHHCSSVLSTLSLPGHPHGIQMTSDTEGSVAVHGHGLIIFTIQNNQITKMKEIRINLNCDFVYHTDKYYIGCDKNIAVHDSNHHKVRDISMDNNVSCMAVRGDTSLCYTLWGGHELYCITMDGTPVFTYSHDKLQYTTGVTVDHAGYIYVCGGSSRNIHQLRHDGKLQRIIFDNLSSAPYCVSMNKRGDTALIGCSGKVLFFDLK
ncbi:hypothetical protein FSP39_004337 [Pinctada imbricata]|uniref:Uncharacterized protein n=1 Tax=Pinctada imbricata TaxID=66713 RepID=A0AA88YMD0_PINIB|nr:hypothetical protein FSP39_004337 [Pinctada imbricata]